MTIYEGPGRGRKQCSCGTYTHVRQKNCPSCGTAFGDPKSKTKTPTPAPAKVSQPKNALIAGIRPFAKQPPPPDVSERIIKQIKEKNSPREVAETESEDFEFNLSDEPEEKVAVVRKTSARDYSHVDELSSLKGKIVRELKLLSQSYSREYLSSIWQEVFGEKLVTRDEYIVQRGMKQQEEIEKIVPTSLEVEDKQILDFNEGEE